MSQSSPGRPEVEAARLLLDRMGISMADLLDTQPPRPKAPTFAEYVPVVAAAVSPGTRKAYGTYWNRVVQAWGDRPIDEPRPSEIEQLRSQVQANVVARRNSRGGRSAAEHLVAALRCLYRRAVADGYLESADNPALKVDKPRRLPSTRQAIGDTRLAEINEMAASTGDDPSLDSLLIRLHTETACRRDRLPPRRRARTSPARRRCRAVPHLPAGEGRDVPVAAGLPDPPPASAHASCRAE